MGLHPSGQELPLNGTCRFCEASIHWGFTHHGHRRIPLDPPRYADDDTTANALVHGDHLGSVYVRIQSTARPAEPGERRYMPHAATCPARARRRPTTNRHTTHT